MDGWVDGWTKDNKHTQSLYVRKKKKKKKQKNKAETKKIARDHVLRLKEQQEGYLDLPTEGGNNKKRSSMLPIKHVKHTKNKKRKKINASHQIR